MSDAFRKHKHHVQKAEQKVKRLMQQVKAARNYINADWGDVGSWEEVNKKLDEVLRFLGEDTQQEGEQIDELSKRTLGSYVKKAADDMYDKGGRAVYHSTKGNKASGAFADASKKKHRAKADDAERRAANRSTGIGRAMNRLTKESAELSESEIEAATKRLKKVKKGSQVSFDHHKHGKVTGTYHGLGRMGGRSYAKVDHPQHGMTYVPVHQVRHNQNESVDEGYKVGDKVNVTNPKALPHHTIVGKSKTHYTIKKPDGSTMEMPKKRIARVNKQAWDLAKADPAKFARRKALWQTESTELEELSLDEISKDKAAAYIKKASKSIEGSARTSHHYADKYNKAYSSKDRAQHKKDYEKHDRKIDNREKGISRAVNRLMKK